MQILLIALIFIVMAVVVWAIHRANKRYMSQLTDEQRRQFEQDIDKDLCVW